MKNQSSDSDSRVRLLELPLDKMEQDEILQDPNILLNLLDHWAEMNRKLCAGLYGSPLLITMGNFSRIYTFEIKYYGKIKKYLVLILKNHRVRTYYYQSRSSRYQPLKPYRNYWSEILLAISVLHENLSELEKNINQFYQKPKSKRWLRRNKNRLVQNVDESGIDNKSSMENSNAKIPKKPKKSSSKKKNNRKTIEVYNDTGHIGRATGTEYSEGQSFGTIRFKNGRIYVGQYDNQGLPNGRGKMKNTWLANTIEAEFKGGKVQSPAKITYEFTDGIYEGEVNTDGLRNGFGKQYKKDGSIFEGEWKDDQRTKGKVTWADGVIYEGEWNHIGLHGFGTETYPDGNYKEGEYDNGKRVGKGKVVTPELGVTYIGEWDSDGNPHGFGANYYDDGEIHEGHFRNGKKVGSGKIIYANDTTLAGWIYKGEWSSKERHGKGVMISPDLEVVDGIWCDNFCTWRSDGKIEEDRKGGLVTNLDHLDHLLIWQSSADLAGLFIRSLVDQ